MFNLYNNLYCKFLSIAFAVRGKIIRRLVPKNGYLLFPPKRRGPERNLKPISSKYGFDRGLPIDRYYIQDFLDEFRKDITGICLEIHDNAYITKYGHDVVRTDVLDIEVSNKLANIHGDLRNLSSIKSETYDCLIITQTFGMIDDVNAAVKECYRILKTGGVLLFTCSVMGPVHDDSYWRFTKDALLYLFSKRFKKENITLRSYGNVLSGQGFWVGLSTSELTKKELDYKDPHYPIIAGARIIK